MDSGDDSSEGLDRRKESGVEGNSAGDSGLTIDLRPAAESDLNAINDIYNYYVLNSTCTYQERPETLSDRRRWFRDHDGRYPVIVAENHGQVVGWGSISPYHQRSAYRFAVENSVYVHHSWHRRGIGSLLLQDLIRRSRILGYRAIIAAIDGEQTQSIRLHAKFDFLYAGRLQGIGCKFGRWLGVVYMELLL
jgi:L-amino acid N-acyltransferase